jgi:IS30 family transposase
MAGRPGYPSGVRREFWERVRAGLSPLEAAAAIGVSGTAGRQWFGDAGGVMPRAVEPAQVRPRLTFEQREEIAILRATKTPDGARTTNAEIARQVGCHRSTIGRELALRSTTFNDGHRPRYRASTAQAHAERSARRSTPSKLAASDRLRQVVQDQLEEEHSPEQISARLKIEFPDDAEMRVSHEPIYQALYVQGRGGLRRDLHKRLRTGRALRKTRRATGERRGKIPGMVNISERPPEVEDRAVPGHWEGDLIVGAHSKSAIGTLVERATGYCMLLHLPADHGAEAVQEAMTQAMSRLPETLRRTLTWDQGAEMTNHVQIAAATDLDIYFCDPHSPWQRGSNENTNGLLRQYFPKGADLSLFAPDYLEHVATKLNRRPRKRLEFRTPAEALDQLLSEPFNPTGVASTA